MRTLLLAAESAPTSTPDGGVAVAQPATLWGTLVRRWRWEFAMLLVLGGWTAFVVLPESLGYNQREAWLLPMWAGSAFLLVLLGIAANSLLRPTTRNAQVFDIGMRTGNDLRAAAALLRIIAWIGVFMLMAGDDWVQVRGRPLPAGLHQPEPAVAGEEAALVAHPRGLRCVRRVRRAGQLPACHLAGALRPLVARAVGTASRPARGLQGSGHHERGGICIPPPLRSLGVSVRPL